MGDEEDVDSDDGKMKRQGAERIEVNLDDINDEDDSESLLGGSKAGLGGLFSIKESHDRGLADMETGSEVYMSELLVIHHYSLTLTFRLDLIWRTSTRQKSKMKKTCLNWGIHSGA